MRRMAVGRVGSLGVQGHIHGLCKVSECSDEPGCEFPGVSRRGHTVAHINEASRGGWVLQVAMWARRRMRQGVPWRVIESPSLHCCVLENWHYRLPLHVEGTGSGGLQPRNAIGLAAKENGSGRDTSVAACTAVAGLLRYDLGPPGMHVVRKESCRGV